MVSSSKHVSLQGEQSSHSRGSHRKDGHGHKKEKVQYYTVWRCCNCQQHGDMKTCITLHCPGCYHQRCQYCVMETKKTTSHHWFSWYLNKANLVHWVRCQMRMASHQYSSNLFNFTTAWTKNCYHFICHPWFVKPELWLPLSITVHAIRYA